MIESFRAIEKELMNPDIPLGLKWPFAARYPYNGGLRYGERFFWPTMMPSNGFSLH